MCRKSVFRVLTLTACCFIFGTTFAQKYDGDMLVNAVGKTSESSEVNDLKSAYHFQMANDEHFLSKEGIELVLKNKALSEIRIYKASSVYGSFAGKLPRGLRFGLTSAEVKKLLGKPSVSYNTGYCEFETNGVIISCWFENDRLSQINLGTK
jgi:hypothetical protein